MPLPPKLKKSVPKKKKAKVMADTMHELTTAPVEAPSRKATHGKQRQKQNVAIALKQSGQSRPPKRKKPRNKGRS